jgi:FkbM family methyltransferase
MIAITKLARTALERLSRGRVLRRRLPERSGARSLFVTPDSALRFLLPGERCFDSMLLSIANRWVKETNVVWDIGANVGVFTFASAHNTRGGKVVAVEPDPFLAGLLRRSCQLHENRDLDVEVLSVAVSDRVGVSKLAIAIRGRCSNSIEGAAAGSEAGGIRDLVAVPTFTLDMMLAHYPAPSFVKIDVEGAEALILKGAERFLSVARPLLLIEVASQNSNEVSETLVRHGYDLYDAEVLGTELRRVEKCSWNTLALPPGALSGNRPALKATA